MHANRPSSTARLIAAATVMCHAARRPSDAPPAGAAEWCAQFLSTSRSDRLLLRSVHSTIGRMGWRIAEWTAVPGIVSHWMRRKREIDRLTRQAAVDGFSQLIVLGSGLDSLAFRLSEEDLYDRILVADHPATLAVVHAAITRHGDRPSNRTEIDPSGAMSSSDTKPGGVNLLLLDFVRDDAAQVISASPAYDTSRATIIVIEGALMYLSADKVHRLLRALASMPNPRLRLLASWMVAEPGQTIGFRNQSRLVERWLKNQNEPMLWASTPAALPGFLAQAAWQTQSILELKRNDLRGGRSAVGLTSEQLVLAERLK